MTCKTKGCNHRETDHEYDEDLKKFTKCKGVIIQDKKVECKCKEYKGTEEKA